MGALCTFPWDTRLANDKTADSSRTWSYVEEPLNGKYALDTNYHFAPVILTEVRNQPAGYISFVLINGPPGILVDSSSGFMQGAPSKLGMYNSSLYAQGQAGERALIQRISFDVRHADTEDAGNGPHGKKCFNVLTTVDAVPFDGEFTCNCSAVAANYQGDNCDEAGERPTDVKFPWPLTTGLLSAFLILMVGSGVAFKYHAHRVSMRAFSFKDEIHSLVEASELVLAANSTTLHNPRELPRSCVKTLLLVGCGHFGEVWKGTLNESSSGGAPSYTVAIKYVRDATSEGAKDLLKEAAVMAQVPEHRNVVSLIGVVTAGAPYYLVLQYCENGSLLGILQDILTPLSENDRWNASLDVAKGMAHLAQHHFVHRDLATRNILVDVENVCQVADFGLSRPWTSDDQTYYSSSTGTFAVRWTSPESMENLRFNTASDVWSFGVVLFEIFSDGSKPYAEMNNQTVIAQVQAGYREPRCHGCSSEMYETMLQCWQDDPDMRPTFSDLARALEARAAVETTAERLQGGRTNILTDGALGSPLGYTPPRRDGFADTTGATVELADTADTADTAAVQEHDVATALSREDAIRSETRVADGSFFVNAMFDREFFGSQEDATAATATATDQATPAQRTANTAGGGDVGLDTFAEARTSTDLPESPPTLATTVIQDTVSHSHSDSDIDGDGHSDTGTVASSTSYIDFAVDMRANHPYRVGEATVPPRRWNMAAMRAHAPTHGRTQSHLDAPSPTHHHAAGSPPNGTPSMPPDIYIYIYIYIYTIYIAV